MSRVAIVTGAAGWLGSSLLGPLLDGMPEIPALRDFRPFDEVRGLVQSDADATRADVDPRVRFVRGDVTDEASLAPLFERAEGATVFHTAAVIHPRAAREFTAVNAQGTRRVLALARRAGVRRFVHVSSNSPFGFNASPADRFTEESPYRPYMGYGKSKRDAELLVNEAQAAGLSTVILRPPWFYGPRQPPRQTLFFSMIRDGKAPIVGKGDQRRSMIYTDNLCHAALLADHVAAADGRAYFVADDEPYTMATILDTVEDVLEKDFGVACKHGRMRLPSVASTVAEGVDALIQGAGLYEQKIHVLGEMGHTIAFDISRAKRELGYAPRVALREGMRRSIEWLMEKDADFRRSMGK